MLEPADPAVVLFIYNRPAVTARVFEAVRAARPRRLFVCADGPRPDAPDDLDRTRRARAATEPVDWTCDVHREYASANLGIKRRVESGLRRVFDAAEEAIVLEDDCHPDPSFFPFCAGLLARYRDDVRVMNICGSRLTPVRPGEKSSYHFSRYPFLWGWATWRRAWQRYDGGMQAWEELRGTPWLERLLGDRYAAAYWTYRFDATRQAAEAGDWDYAWLFTSWLHGGLSIIPAINMVSNLGFDAEASHTRDPRSPFAALPFMAMTFPMVHPGEVSTSIREETLAASVVFSGNLERLMGTLHRRIHRGV